MDFPKQKKIREHVHLYYYLIIMSQASPSKTRRKVVVVESPSHESGPRLATTTIMRASRITHLVTDPKSFVGEKFCKMFLKDDGN